jgi:hypothetical protein
MTHKSYSSGFGSFPNPTPVDKDKHAKQEDKPEEGKVYALTGGPSTRCIANGNSWAESEVKDDGPAADAAGK